MFPAGESRLSLVHEYDDPDDLPLSRRTDDVLGADPDPDPEPTAGPCSPSQYALFAPSTPEITLSPPSGACPSGAFSPPPPPPRTPAPLPSQSADDAVQLALALALGNDRYSFVAAPPPRPASTPPAFFGRRAAPYTPPASPGLLHASPPQTPHGPRTPTTAPSSPVAPRRQRPPELRFGSEYMERVDEAPAPAVLNRAPRAPMGDGALEPPSPLMLRPRPIWRATPRSALGAPAYAPGAHLVRRATFVAAGLDLAGPLADMSALGVETRAVLRGREGLGLGGLPGMEV